MEDTRKLSFPGDRTSSIGNILGPDMSNRLWKVVDAVYSEEDDKTTISLDPYVPAKS